MHREFKICSTLGRTLFEEGQLNGHKLALEPGHGGVLADARADALDYLKDWVDAISVRFKKRVLDDIATEYRWMLKALDLRKLILPLPSPNHADQLLHLRYLWRWARNKGKADLPEEFAVMQEQHDRVTKALSQGRKRAAFMESDVVKRELAKKARLSFMA